MLISLIQGLQIQIDQDIAEEQGSKAHHHHWNTVGDTTAAAAAAPTHDDLHLKWKAKCEV